MRRYGRKAALLGIVSVMCLIPTAEAQLTDPAPESPSAWSFSTRTMGTVATVQVANDDSLAAADLAYDALLAFHHADSLLSNWTQDSAIARVNREAGSGWSPLGPELLEILGTAGRVWAESEGAFDPTIEPLVRAWGFLGGTPHVPSAAQIEEARALVGWSRVELDPAAARIHFDREGIRLDLGGIAKGFSVDRVAEQLEAADLRNFLVDLSGNMAVRGAPRGAEAWRIGVRDPRDLLPHLGILALNDLTVASSGDYEQFVNEDGKRFGHILDPRTGRPVEGMAGVTVIAPSAMLADAWATALFVLGLDAAREIAAQREDLSCILIERGDEDTLVLWAEESLRPIFTPHPSLSQSTRFNWF